MDNELELTLEVLESTSPTVFISFTDSHNALSESPIHSSPKTSDTAAGELNR